MGLGFGAMGAAEGAGNDISQVFDQRMRMAQLAQQDALTRLKAQEQADAVQARLEQSKQAEKDRTTAAEAMNQERKDRLATLQFPLISTDQTLTGDQVKPFAEAGLGAGFRPTPVQAPAAPPGIAAPDQPAGPTPMPGTIANAPAPGRVNFQRIPSPAEQDRQAAAAERAKQDAGMLDIRQTLAGVSQQNADTASQRADKGPTPHFAAQDRYIDGKPVAGVLDTSTGIWKAHPDEGSVHAAPGASQIAAQETKKKEAIDTLGQLDQAIDSAKDMLGPGAGRVSSLEQMVGSADPKMQALGTKMLIAKMKIDASIGGMRAASSPALLARWDNLLANKVTPEGLHAATQALREIIGGNSSSGGGKVEKWGRDASGNLVKQ